MACKRKPQSPISEVQHKQSRTEQELTRGRIPDGDFISLTSIFGKRVYVPLKPDIKVPPTCTFQQTLTAVKLLVQQVLLDTDINPLNSVGHENSTDAFTEGNNTNTSANGLFVDRYSPHTYFELLSDESLNRTLLCWLKCWDASVFGKPKRNVIASSLVGSKRAALRELSKINKKTQMDDLYTEELDEFKRPEHKVALICGPPGLGKTTLAHVVAKQAGYNVVEINASDDRSGDVFHQKLVSATALRSFNIGYSETGAEAVEKPNCLIIDEIDGASGAAIEMLIAMVNGTARRAKKSTAKKDSFGLLMRPVICICNDLYATCLKPLRQVALVLHIKQILPAQLANRLRLICQEESITTDLTSLIALSERTDCDIRSCLNALQFFKASRSALSLTAIEKLTLGQKDCTKNVSGLLHEIFTLPKPGKRQLISNRDMHAIVETTGRLPTTSSDQKSDRFARLLKLVSNSSELERLEQGLYENFLDQKIRDENLRSVRRGLDWLSFSDLMQTTVQERQCYQLMPYQYCTAVAFGQLFGTHGRLISKPFGFPMADMECSRLQRKHASLVESFFADLRPSVAQFLESPVSAASSSNALSTARSCWQFVTQFLPYFSLIIQPSIRPVNMQLLSVAEREQVQRLVQIMADYGVNYRQERSADGTFNYVLEPNIEEVVAFGGVQRPAPMTYATKQLLAREVDLARMRRAPADSERAADIAASLPAAPDPPHLQPAADAPAAPQLPRHLQRLHAKRIIAIAEQVDRDFFGRVIQPKASDTSTGVVAKATASLLIGGLCYRYKEGCTNAVRRSVRLSDLSL